MASVTWARKRTLQCLTAYTISLLMCIVNTVGSVFRVSLIETNQQESEAGNTIVR